MTNIDLTTLTAKELKAARTLAWCDYWAAGQPVTMFQTRRIAEAYDAEIARRARRSRRG
jgi:hypothetical protein